MKQILAAAFFAALAIMPGQAVASPPPAVEIPYRVDGTKNSKTAPGQEFHRLSVDTSAHAGLNCSATFAGENNHSTHDTALVLRSGDPGNGEAVLTDVEGEPHQLTPADLTITLADRLEVFVRVGDDRIASLRGTLRLAGCTSPVTEVPADGGTVSDSTTGETVEPGGAERIVVTTPVVRERTQARRTPPRPELIIRKSASRSTTGGPVLWRVLVTNIGPGVARNVVIRDRIPAGSALRTRPRLVTIEQGNTVVYRAGNVRPGETVILRLPATVFPGERACNVATVTAAGVPKRFSNRSCVRNPTSSTRFIPAVLG